MRETTAHRPRSEREKEGRSEIMSVKREKVQNTEIRENKVEKYRERERVKRKGTTVVRTETRETTKRAAVKVGPTTDFSFFLFMA